MQQFDFRFLPYDSQILRVARLHSSHKSAQVIIKKRSDSRRVWWVNKVGALLARTAAVTEWQIFFQRCYVLSQHWDKTIHFPANLFNLGLDGEKGCSHDGLETLGHWMKSWGKRTTTQSSRRKGICALRYETRRCKALSCVCYYWCWSSMMTVM